VDDFDDGLPNLEHWKTVMEFTVEQAALLMASLDPLDTNLEDARKYKLDRWKQAHAFSMGIVSAIRQGLISPVRCRGLVWREGWNDSMVQVMETIKVTDRDAEISVTETIITRASLLGWISSEKVQIVRPRPATTKIPLPVAEVPLPKIEAKPELPALLGFDHKSEGLEFVKDAIRELWSTYDPDDINTAPTKPQVIEYLKDRGASGNVAEAVDLILRPHSLRGAKLKNRRVPTREDE
jgi:hypothetical protein